MGTFSFNWDGTGEIYICSNCNANIDTDVIWTDDEIIVKNVVTGHEIYQIDAPNPGVAGPLGTSPEGSANSPDLNITSLLVTGNNNINITISDLYGSLTGCSPLFFVQIGGSGKGLSAGTNTGGSGGYTDVNIELTSGVMQFCSPPATIEIGTYTFNWDGNGKLYLASSSDPNVAMDVIQFTDTGTITSSMGSITTGAGTINDVDITSICAKGNNTITLNVNSTGMGIGCSSLYLIQVDS